MFFSFHWYFSMYLIWMHFYEIMFVDSCTYVPAWNTCTWLFHATLVKSKPKSLLQHFNKSIICFHCRECTADTLVWFQLWIHYLHVQLSYCFLSLDLHHAHFCGLEKVYPNIIYKQSVNKSPATRQARSVHDRPQRDGSWLTTQIIIKSTDLETTAKTTGSFNV